MKTAILGTGITGRSCARHLADADDLVMLDTRAAPGGLRELGDFDVRLDVQRFDFTGFDRVIVSPGIALDNCLVRSARDAGAELVSDVDLFFEAANAPVYTVTGTNGKSTVTSMAAALLNAHGVNAAAGGNLGEAALDVLAEDKQAYVLELSSFQLERLRPHAKAASALLNISDDHLDRHGSLASYTAAKQRVYDGAQLCVFNRDDRATWPAGHVAASASFALSAGEVPGEWGIVERADGVWFANGDQAMVASSSLALEGTHNQANLLAACALLDDVGLSAQTVEQVARSFSGLPHRAQTVGELQRAGGVVRFINDSKATNVGATLAAVRGLQSGLDEGGKIVLIAGGDGKGADFTPLGELAAHLRSVVLIGRDAERIARAFSACPQDRCNDLPSAVHRAAELARPGDVVLLSPACASFDMFTSYVDRGEQFADIVAALVS